ncbi:IPP2 inhibitor, partial [Polypterus senegalus]
MPWGPVTPALPPHQEVLGKIRTAPESCREDSWHFRHAGAWPEEECREHLGLIRGLYKRGRLHSFSAGVGWRQDKAREERVRVEAARRKALCGQDCVWGLAGDEEEGSVGDSESYEPLTADDLVKKLAAAEGSQPKIFMKEDDEDSEEEEELSPEEQAKKKQFKMKRKVHYNEGLNIKIAVQLIARELEEDDEEMKDETEVDNAHMDLPQDENGE